MKRLFLMMVIVTVLFGLTISAHSALTNNGDGTLSDSHTNLMWIQDANYAVTSGWVAANSIGDGTGSMSWYEALDWIDYLNTTSYLGYSDWRLPLCGEGAGPSSTCTNSDMAHLYSADNVTYSTPQLFTNLKQYSYWSGTTNSPDTTQAWGFSFNDGFEGAHGKSPTPHNWAMAVRVVPEPISSTLFIIGGATFGVRSFWKRSNG